MWKLFSTSPSFSTPALSGIHSFQHPAHSHSPTLWGEALQVQALWQSLRLTCSPWQPCAPHTQQGEGLHLLGVQPALSGAGGLPFPHEDSCRSLGKSPMDISSCVYRSMCMCLCVVVCTPQEVTFTLAVTLRVCPVSGPWAYFWM